MTEARIGGAHCSLVDVAGMVRLVLRLLERDLRMLDHGNIPGPRDIPEPPDVPGA